MFSADLPRRARNGREAIKSFPEFLNCGISLMSSFNFLLLFRSSSRILLTKFPSYGIFSLPFENIRNNSQTASHRLLIKILRNTF